MPVGQLIVDFVASTAKYQEDLGKAAAQSEATARRIEKSINGAFDSIKSKVIGLGSALGVGLSITGFEQLISGAIEAEAAFGRIGARAGLTGEEVSKLSRAARLSHTDLSDLADMSAKLSKALLSSQESGSKQEAVFRALGFTSKDTARLLADPVNALQELSKAVVGLPEGTRSAATLLLLGRGGSAAAAAMDELAKQTDLVAIRSNAEIAVAKELEDRFSDLSAKTTALKTDLANALVPTIDAVLSAFIKMTTGTTDARAGLKQLAEDGSIREWAKDAVLAIGTVVESLIFIGRLIGAVSNSVLVVAADLRVATAVHALSVGGGSADELLSAVNARNSQLGFANEKWEQLWKDRATVVTDALKVELTAISAAKEPVGFAGGSADAVQRRQEAAAARAKAVQDAVRDANRKAAGDDPARKILEAALAALKANTEQERAVLQNREQFLQAIYDRGNSTIEDYYAGKQAAQDEDLSRTSENYRQEIALLDRFIATAKTQQDRAQGEKEKVAVTGRQQLAVIQAAGKAQQILDEQERALREFGHTLDEVNAKMLDLEGNTAAAARIRFDAQNETLRNRLQAVVDSPASTEAAVKAARAAQERLDVIGRLTEAQAKLNDVQQKYGNIIDHISVKQARIDLEQQTGQITEIDAINKKSAAAQERIAELTAKLAEFAATVNDPALADGPVKDAALLRIEQMRLEIDKLAASTDVLDKKFRDIFVGEAATFLDDVISRTKTWRQTLEDAAKSLEHAITKVATQNIAETVFGKQGPLGGVPGFFSGLFGGGKGAGEGIGVSTLGTAATTSAAALTTIDAPAIALAASLTAAASAATAFSISASAGGLGGAFFGSDAGGLGAILGPGGLFGFAGGGDPPLDRPSIVGEHGRPEIFWPKAAGTVIPMDQYRNRRGSPSNVTIHIHVPQGTSRASADQIGLAAARYTQRAAGKLG